MEALKGAGSAILGIALFVAMIFIAVLFIEGTATVSEKVIPFAHGAVAIAILISVVIFLPLSIFRATRIVPVWGFLIASYVFGLDAWMYGFLVTYDLWGGGGVFAGLFLGVVGVVPLGIIASALHGLWFVVGQLIFFIAITYGARLFAFFLANTLDRAAAEAA